MSNARKKQQNKENLEYDDQAAKYNKAMKIDKTPRFYKLKKIALWFWPVEGKRLPKEAVTNLLTILLPIIVFIIYSIGKHQMEEGSSNEELGGTMFAEIIFAMSSIFVWTYKLVLILQRKKGNYFKEYKKRGKK